MKLRRRYFVIWVADSDGLGEFLLISRHSVVKRMAQICIEDSKDSVSFLPEAKRHIDLRFGVNFPQVEDRNRIAGNLNEARGNRKSRLVSYRALDLTCGSFGADERPDERTNSSAR